MLYSDFLTIGFWIAAFWEGSYILSGNVGSPATVLSVWGYGGTPGAYAEIQRRFPTLHDHANININNGLFVTKICTAHFAKRLYITSTMDNIDRRPTVPVGQLSMPLPCHARLQGASGQ